MSLFILCVTICTFWNNVVALKPNVRIVGGTEVTNRSEFAYQALLLYKNVPYCGGTIIDEKHILTAAHCCYITSEIVKPSELSVVVGNLQLYDFSNKEDVDIVIVHEDYDSESILNDIALITISGNFENTTDIQPIELANYSVTSGNCRASGWGTISWSLQILSNKLLYADVPIVNTTYCKSAYPPLGNKQICAGEEGKDSCQGDSGGPLVCSGYLAGIVSYGYKCGVLDFPGVYTEVYKYLDWIEEAKLRSSANKEFISLILFGGIFLINLFQYR